MGLVAVVVLVAGGIGIVRLAQMLGTAALPDPRPATPVNAAPPPYRAFSPDSWWNTPLPDGAPLDPAANQVLRYLREGPDSGRGCLMLAGASKSQWGQPIYSAHPGDPTYDVTGVTDAVIPELHDLRIPRGARPAANQEASMTVYDKQRGYVVLFTGAEFHAADDRWTATGASVTYLRSNGLHVRTRQADDRRNRGTHRGNNGATVAVTWDEVFDGAIRHVLRVSSGPELSSRFVFPMVGSDGDYHGNNPGIPPQGLRMRISPTVDLDALNLDQEALVIATALQKYGMYLGGSGRQTTLKLEDMRLSGRGLRWALKDTALCGLPFTPKFWDVIAEGYDPTR